MSALLSGLNALTRACIDLAAAWHRFPHPVPGAAPAPFDSDLVRILEDPRGVSESEVARIVTGGVGTYADLFASGRSPKAYNGIPLAAWSWMRYSRRVFRIPRDLALLLLAADFDAEGKSADLVLPFPSFAVEFDAPLELPGFAPFPGFVFYRIPHAVCGTIETRASGLCTEMFGVLAPSTKAGTYEPLSLRERNKVRDDSRRGRKGRRTKIANRLAGHLDGAIVNDSIAALGESARMAEGPMPGEEPDPAFEACCKIAWGLAMYLEAFVPDVPTGPFVPTGCARTRRARQSRQGVRVSVGETFRVDCAHRLSDRGRRLLEDRVFRGGTSPGPHWRCGHWRRSPGTGQDPTAPKNVRVSPSLVMEAALQEGEVPQGAVTKTT